MAEPSFFATAEPQMQEKAPLCPPPAIPTHITLHQTPQPQPPLPSISPSDLQSHCSPDDLWIAIHGLVYNVTSWLPSHPGGDIPLLSLAGQDATDAFLAFHPARASLFLPRFLVGSLSSDEVSPLASDYRRTLQQLQKAGLFRKDLRIYLVIALVVLALMVQCFVGVLCSNSFLVHLGSALSLGIVWTQCGWIGHDSGHSALLGKPKLDRWIQLVVGSLTGIGLSWWKRNHNAHHISCNIVEHDPDLHYIPLFAVSSRFFSSLHSYFYERKMEFDGVARLLVSYQHWTFYPVMAIARINLFAQTMILLLSSKKVANRGLEIAGIVFFWIWFCSLLACLPNTAERAAFVLVSFGVTGIQHVQFCLNHFSSPVSDGRPNGKAWFQSQVNGTLNISCYPWMDWFHGGLQFQIEHHLFPLVPRHNLRRISSLVKALCEKHGLSYNSVSFWEANVMIIRTLRTAALQARDLSKPSPKNLLWEAVNAQG